MLIGDFARLGQVSVRMLRHYDALGLLRPAHVDQWSGYRSYDPGQLPALNRIVALRELGFSLAQIGELHAADLPLEELRGMLRLRRAQVEDEVRAAGIRLAAVESRLRMIEKENAVPIDPVTKTLPALRLAALTARIPREELGQHIGPMFRRVEAALAPQGAPLATAIATYDDTGEGMDVVVGYALEGDAGVPRELTLVELPEKTGVCAVHLGPMTTIGESWQELYRSVVDSGHRPDGPCREHYIRAESPDQADWVTELQQPIAD